MLHSYLERIYLLTSSRQIPKVRLIKKLDTIMTVVVRDVREHVDEG